MNSDRQGTKYNQIVGIKDGLVYVLEESFQYGEKGMRGCVGYAMETLSQETIDSRNDIDNLTDEYAYLWREAVASQSTELGLSDYIVQLTEDADRAGLYFFGDDDSFRYEFNNLVDDLSEDQKETLKRYFGEKDVDFVDWDCASCGRCFDPNEKWDEIFRPDLIEVINDFEREELKDGQ